MAWEAAEVSGVAEVWEAAVALEVVEVWEAAVVWEVLAARAVSEMLDYFERQPKKHLIAGVSSRS